ncbi:hypothetical protein OHA98_21205 [Streptomyces sp. NBC_00654]|nr:hypothetical protein [Streptomyces sp. NBC_00654]MCX4967241.1 hypothetical protein [Streptomyces sp. NBC_00654]
MSHDDFGSITAVVLRSTTKAADAPALLARSLTPEAMRPVR